MKTTGKETRAEREKFRKRRKGLIKKANELSSLCQTDLYLVMYQGGRYYTYKSTDRQAWPPSEKDLSHHYPLCDHKTPSDFKPVVPRERKSSSDAKAVSALFENVNAYTRKSDMTRLEQKNEAALQKTRAQENVDIQSDIEKETHTTRSFVIPNPPVLTVHVQYI